MSESLNTTQLQVRKATKSLEQSRSGDPFLTRIAYSLQERFGIGRYITRAEIKGGVGEPLTVTLGGVALNGLLPPGVEFYGFRHIKDKNGENYYEKTVYHHYNRLSKQICLAVECEPDSSFKLSIQKTPIAGLIIAHEMGHAEDDYKRPERRVETARTFLQAAVFEDVEDLVIRSWYDQARGSSRQFTGIGSATTQSFQRDVEYAIQNHIRRIAFDMRIKRGSRAGLVTLTEYDKLTEEIAQSISQEVLGRWDALASAEGLCSSVHLTRSNHQYALQDFLRTDTIRSEVEAWILAEKIEQRLKRANPKLSLWNGDEKSLRLLKAYFILHHPYIKFEDIPEGEIKTLLEGITKPHKIYGNYKILV